MLKEGGNKKCHVQKIFIDTLLFAQRNINISEIPFLLSRTIHFNYKCFFFLSPKGHMISFNRE